MLGCSAPLGFTIPKTWSRDSQIIQGATASLTPFSVKAASGQSANVFQVLDSTGAILLSVDPSGNLTVKGSDNVTINDSITGTLTVTGTSTLTGNVTIGGNLSVAGTTSLASTTVTNLIVTGTITGPGLGTVTSVSVVTANGVSGSVATATTTPAITLTLGAITPTSVNGLTITSTTGTFTLTNAKTFSVSNTLTLSGTDGTTMTFPTTSATIARTDAANTFTGHQTIEGVTSTGATGSGRFVFDNTPTLITPVLGVATATTVNKVTITTPATGSTLTIADGKTLTISNTMTLAGGDSTSITFPNASATMARTDAGQTFTGTQIMTSPKILTSILDTNGNTMVGFTTTSSATTYVGITNRATGTSGPSILSAGETNVDLQIGGIGTGELHYKSGTYCDYTTDTVSSHAVTCDVSVSNVHTFVLGASGTPTTITLSNAKAGQTFVLRPVQDSSGSCLITWFTTIKWAGGSAPTLTTTANKADEFIFLCTSAGNYDGFIVGQNI